MTKNREYTYFGPAGNGQMFYDAGYKKSMDMPKYLSEVGLNWYEYPCGRGINIGNETARLIGKEAAKNNIGMSVHAPYYINLANPEEEKRRNSINYIIESLKIAKEFGAQRVVFHPGTCRKMTRTHAMDILLDTMPMLISEIDNIGLDDIIICPETMGKKNQLGNLKEIISICKLDDRIVPTLDFGHLNARRHGSLQSEVNYSNILDAVENELGNYRMRNIHIHFSHVEYTNSGERRHLTFEDEEYGPFFKHFVHQLIKRKMTAVIICESKNTMINDALIMKDMYTKLL